MPRTDQLAQSRPKSTSSAASRRLAECRTNALLDDAPGGKGFSRRLLEARLAASPATARSLRQLPSDPPNAARRCCRGETSERQASSALSTSSDHHAGRGQAHKGSSPRGPGTRTSSRSYGAHEQLSPSLLGTRVGLHLRMKLQATVSRPVRRRQAACARTGGSHPCRRGMLFDVERSNDPGPGTRLGAASPATPFARGASSPSSSTTRRIASSCSASSARPRASIIRTRSPGEATHGRRPPPRWTRSARRRRSRWPLVPSGTSRTRRSVPPTPGRTTHRRPDRRRRRGWRSVRMASSLDGRVALGDHQIDLLGDLVGPLQDAGERADEDVLDPPSSSLARTA